MVPHDPPFNLFVRRRVLSGRGAVDREGEMKTMNKCKCKSRAAEICEEHELLVFNLKMILHQISWIMSAWLDEFRWWLGKKIMGRRWLAMALECPFCGETFALHPVERKEPQC